MRVITHSIKLVCFAVVGWTTIAHAETPSKPIVGGEAWVFVGTTPNKWVAVIHAEVDTGADRSSIDAVDYDIEQLEVGQEFDFSLVTERVRIGTRPIRRAVFKKVSLRAKLEKLGRVNGVLRPYVKLWFRVGDGTPIRLLVTLNDRNRRERMLLGEDWTDGKLVDTEIVLGKKPQLERAP